MTEYNSQRTLQNKFREIERRLRGLESTAQLGFSSVVSDGAIKVYDKDGTLVQQVGTQFDGTYTSASLGGPTPPTPTTPTVAGVVGGLDISWDGLFTDAAYAPMDFSRVEVHASAASGFEITQENLVNTFESPQGGKHFVSFPDSNTYYVKLVTRTQSGKLSPESGQASGVPQSVEAGEIIPPAAPTGLVETSSWYYSPNWLALIRFDLSWNAVTVDEHGGPTTISGYEVWYSENGGDYVFGAASQTTSVTLYALKPDTTYSFKVRAVNQVPGQFSGAASGNFPSSSIVETIPTPDTMPAQSQMTVALISYDALTSVSAVPPGQIAFVEVGYKTTSGGTYNTITTFGSPRIPQSVPVANAGDPNDTAYLALRYTTYMGNRGAWAPVNPSPLTIVGIVDEDLINTSLQEQFASVNSAVSAVQVSANGKNTITYSTANPSGTGVVGDTWFKQSGNIIVAQWTWDGSSWIAKTLDNDVIANLDAGKINAGTISAERIGAGTIAASALAANSVTASAIATGAITAGKIAANAVTAGSINAGAIDGMIITGAVVQTDYSGQRVVLDALGLHGYNELGQEVTTISSDTGALSAASGTFSGKIVGSEIIGAVLKTGTTGNRMYLGDYYYVRPPSQSGDTNLGGSLFWYAPDEFNWYPSNLTSFTQTNTDINGWDNAIYLATGYPNGSSINPTSLQMDLYVPSPEDALSDGTLPISYSLFDTGHFFVYSGSPNGNSNKIPYPLAIQHNTFHVGSTENLKNGLYQNTSKIELALELDGISDGGPNPPTPWNYVDNALHSTINMTASYSGATSASSVDLNSLVGSTEWNIGALTDFSISKWGIKPLGPNSADFVQYDVLTIHSARDATDSSFIQLQAPPEVGDVDNSNPNYGWVTIANESISLAAKNVEITANNGTGTLNSDSLFRLTASANLSATSTGHALQIGLTNSPNLRFDTSGISAVSGGTLSDLDLNRGGGIVHVGQSQSSGSPELMVGNPAGNLQPNLSLVRYRNSQLYKALFYATATSGPGQLGVQLQIDGTSQSTFYFNEGNTGTGNITANTNSVTRPVTPFAMQMGTVSTSTGIAQNAGWQPSISFASGRFTQAPFVFVAVDSPRLTTDAESITTSGFTGRAYNWTTSTVPSTKMTWLAIQMTSSNTVG